ncbi:CBO0543 family protein [Bacillus pinisoli]|uniref:CBO0543 family protein n=1 Tax=Bacillus pinisoli TaxID=2901866 RepID=UPI001FF124CE|nr:CBO0543 family protein [Bacillus pinisoli]
MHIAIAFFIIFAVWKWGDWRNWQKYHTVMLYFAVGNLTYNFLTASYFLWRLDSDLITNHTLTEMLYTFITFPGSALLFICNYPENKGRGKVLLHYVYWILIYGVIEWIMTKTGYIKYQYGWSLAWSIGFDTFMFPMLRLFYKRPLIAYLLSVPIGIFFIWYFKVPVHIPVEKR